MQFNAVENTTQLYTSSCANTLSHFLVIFGPEMIGKIVFLGKLMQLWIKQGKNYNEWTFCIPYTVSRHRASACISTPKWRNEEVSLLKINNNSWYSVWNAIWAQLFSTNAFSANKFCHNVLSTFTSIYSQFIVTTNNFFSYFYQRKEIFWKRNRIYLDKTNSVRVID